MKVQAKFFASFRDLYGGRTREIEIPDGRNAGDLLGLLCDTPARREGLFDGNGLKPHLIVMINGTHINSLAGLGTPLAEGDVVAVFPMLGGG